MEKNSRIFITGGAGFIGKHLIAHLSKTTTNSIWVYDNLHPQVHGTHCPRPSFPNGTIFIKNSVTNFSALEMAIHNANPDIIVHLASETGTSQSMDEITRYCEVNVLGTSHLIDAAIKSAPNLKKIILSSSRAVYGEGPWKDHEEKTFIPKLRTIAQFNSGQFDHSMIKEQNAVPLKTNEEVPTNPCSIYGSTKLIQEHLIHLASQKHSWDTVILRFQNVYGPGQSLTNPYTGILSIFSKQLFENKKLEIYEDGKITRDFIYVDDVVNSICKSIKTTLKNGEILNIGSGQGIYIQDIAQILLELFCRPENDYFISGNFRLGDIRHAVADISKAKKLLGWNPEVDIKKGMEYLVKYNKKIL